MIAYTPVDSFNPAPLIYDISDFVIGGINGTSNLPLEALINNTFFLESRMGRYDKVLTLTDNYTWAITEKRSFLSFLLNANKTCQLPPVATSLPGTRIVIATTIQTVNGANKCLKIRCDTTNNDLIANGSNQVPYLYMHDGERLVLVAAGTYWEIENATGNFDTVGDTYGARMLRKNTMVCQGSLVSRSDYGRLWDFVTTLTGGQEVVTDAQWLSDPFKYTGCFSYGNGDIVSGTTFRIPDERAMSDRYLDLNRNVDFSRVHDFAGGYEADAVLKHQHFGYGEHRTDWPYGTQDKDQIGSGGTDHDNFLFGTTFAGTGENLIKSIGKIPLINY